MYPPPLNTHTHTPTQMFDSSHSPTNSVEEVDGEGRERVENDTKHAPDILEGPDINSEGV